MTPTATTEINLYPQQGAYVGTSAHECAFVGGIGSGKSIAGCVRALMASQGRIGARTRIQTPNLGVITAPTYPMLRDATVRSFQDIAGDAITHFNKSEGLAILANGSEVIFRSTENPDRLRGPSISWWFGDEAAMYSPDVWKIMLGRLRQFGERGYAWIATTPRGRNWVWQTFIQDARLGRKIFRATSADNIYLDPAIVAAWRESYAGSFAEQELGGEFVAFEGLIYPEFNRERHVAQTVPERFAYTVAGVDWGFAHPGVILVFGVDSDGRMWMVSEHYQRQRRVEEWAEVAKQEWRIWDVQTFFCDPAEPDYIQTFINAGVPAEPAENDINAGLQVVKNRLVMQGDGRPRLNIGPQCVYTISEFESYQWAENRYGIRDQPLKTNDHAMDALRYACMGVRGGVYTPGELNYADTGGIGRSVY